MNKLDELRQEEQEELPQGGSNELRIDKVPDDWSALVEQQQQQQAAQQNKSEYNSLVVTNIRLGAAGEHAVVQLLLLLSQSSSSIPSWQSVTLANLHLTAGNTRVLADAVPWPTLQALKLNQNASLGPRGMKTWCEYLKKAVVLQRLDCTGCHVQHFGAQALGQVLPATLTYLNLQHNKLGADGVWKMAHRLQQLTVLEELNLAHNDIRDDGCLELARNLPLSSSLQGLHLAGNGIQDAGLTELCKMLPCLTQLQTLDLSHNRLADSAAKQLSMALRQCPSLELLDLAHNEIADSGCVALVEALLPPDQDEDESESESEEFEQEEGHSEELFLNQYGERIRHEQSRLREIRLNHNVIGDEGAGALVEHMDQIVALQTVTLNENNISDARMRILDMLLKHRSSMVSSSHHRKSITTETSVTPETSEREDDGFAPMESPLKKQDDKGALDVVDIEKGREILLTSLSSDEDDAVPRLPLAYVAHITDKWNQVACSHGAFGPLFHATDKEATEQDFNALLVRKLQLSSAGKMEGIRAAVLAELSHLRHDSLASLIGIAVENGTYAFVYDIPNSEARPLRKCLTDPELRKLLNWPGRLHVAHRIAGALEFLHQNSPSRKVALHGDLHVDQIYVSSDFEQAYLLDAGMSRLLATDRTRFASGDVVYGSRAYRCPRYERGSATYDASSDIFSFGVILAELMTSTIQRSKRNKTDLAYDVYYDCVLTRQPLRTDPLAGPVSKLLMQTWGQLTLACLSPIPAQRPTASTAVHILKDLSTHESGAK